MDYIGDHSVLEKKGESFVNKTGKKIHESPISSDPNENKEKLLQKTFESFPEKEKSCGLSDNLCQEDGYVLGSTETDNPETEFTRDPRPKLQSTLDLLLGYKSLIDSYNHLSQTFSKHLGLTQTPYLLDQVRELRAENDRYKQENLHLQHTINNLLIENNQLKVSHPPSPNLQLKHTTFPVFSNHPPPTQGLFPEVFERQSHELTLLQSEVKNLSVFRDQFLQIDNEQHEIAEKLKALIDAKDLAQKEIKALAEQVKKTENLLEVAKLHRDLLDKKVKQMKVIGDYIPSNEFEDIEKRVKMLEQRVKGTEDVEKYISKYKLTSESLKLSDKNLKHLQQELEESKAKNKQLEQYIKTSQGEKPSAKVLTKLVHLLHSSARQL